MSSTATISIVREQGIVKPMITAQEKELLDQLAANLIQIAIKQSGKLEVEKPPK